MRNRMRRPSRWLGSVLAAHTVILVVVTIVTAHADTLQDQILVLNLAVASQIVAFVACASWLFTARRAVVTRLRSRRRRGVASV